MNPEGKLWQNQHFLTARPSNIRCIFMARANSYLVAFLFCCALFALDSSSVHSQPPRSELPEGSTGIAARYPGDTGIEQDPRVVFVEDFEQPSMDQVKVRWEAVKADSTLSLSGDVPHGGGKHSLQIHHVGG